jgi:hypothetical protein
MSRIQIIMLSVLGLMVVAVVFWCVHVFSSDKSTQNGDTMTDVPEKYTYEDMIKSVGDKGFPIDETPAAAPIPSADPQNNISDPIPAPAATGEGDNNKSTPPADPPEIRAALADIQKARKNIKASVIASEQQESAEDEEIKKIVSERSQIAPVPQQLPAPEQQPATGTAATGFNTMSFGGGSSGTSVRSATSIRGVILNEVEVATGGKVRIMLLENVTLNGVQLRKTQMVTGAIGVGDTRVQVKVAGAAVDGQLAAIVFSVFGTDGIEGLPIEGNPGTATQQAAREETERNIENVAGGGVLGSVVRVAKTLGTSRQRSTTVKIPAGYKVILKTDNR